MYKSVRPDGLSHQTDTVKYAIGIETIAPDWDKNFTDECGHGLYFSPTPKQAVSFNDSGLYLACRVKISDIASLPPCAEYPDKIRVRACVPLYKIDIDGNKIL